jgi:hypothetical protein
MILSALLATLEYWDRAGIWSFSLPVLSQLFGESGDTLNKSLSRHQRTGMIERIARGLYINPRARSLPPDVLSALPAFLRPWDLNYLSLESALSEAGWLSQLPSQLTLMTTGRSQTFHTPYGTLEFTHTARHIDTLRDDLVFDARRKMYVAKPERALKDLRRAGRNVDLVQIPSQSPHSDHAISHPY